MNIFAIHDDVTGRYGQYVESFLSIADDEIQQFIIREVFEKRALWPDALIQLNPAYEKTAEVRQQALWQR